MTLPAAEQEAPFVMPTTRDGFKQLFAELFSETMSNPDNAALLAKTVFAASHNALLGQIGDRLREQRKPVVVREAYDDAWKCTVQGGLNGTLTVLIEEQIDGVWTKLKSEDGIYQKASGLVLSQTAVPGDVFYITDSLRIEAARDAYVDAYMEHLHKEQTAAADAPHLKAIEEFSTATTGAAPVSAEVEGLR
jgi:hypothetical protein